MKRVIVVGSPRSKGRSAHLAEMLFEANIDECPEDEIFLVPVSEVEIGPCHRRNALARIVRLRGMRKARSHQAERNHRDRKSVV